MKQTLKKSLWVIIPSVCVVFAVTSFAGGQDLGRLLDNPGIMHRAMQKLELTDEQMQSLKDLQADTEKKSIDIEAGIKKGHIELREEMGKEDVNVDKVMGFLDEIGKQQTEMKKLQFSKMIEAKKLLTPEQREKAREMIGNWKRSQAMRKQRQMPGEPGSGRRFQERPDPGRFNPPQRNRGDQPRHLERNRQNQGPRADFFDPEVPDLELANIPEPDPDF